MAHAKLIRHPKGWLAAHMQSYQIQDRMALLQSKADRWIEILVNSTKTIHTILITEIVRSRPARGAISLSTVRLFLCAAPRIWNSISITLRSTKDSSVPCKLRRDRKNIFVLLSLFQKLEHKILTLHYITNITVAIKYDVARWLSINMFKVDLGLF